MHLREVCSVGLTTRWDKSIWLFGNTNNRNSVAVHVRDFRPYFYIDRVDLSAYTLQEDMNEELGNCIINILPATLTPVVGFCFNEGRGLFKIIYKNHGQLPKLRRYFTKRSFQINSVSSTARMYHDDWPVESLFLHETNVQMQDWIEIDTVYSDPCNITTCQLEVTTLMGKVKCIPALGHPEVLVCAIRTQSSLEACPSKLKVRKIESISCVYYWLGEGVSIRKSYTNVQEQRLLSSFYDDIHRADVDCFSLLSDCNNPLVIIASRSRVVSLSKFLPRKARNRYYRNNSGPSRIRPSDFDLIGGELTKSTTGKVASVDHAGRSRLDIRCAMEKLQIEPKLGGFTLKDAMSHPKILREPCTAELGSIIEEADYIFQIEHDTNMLLGYVQLSHACFANVTVVVEGGQQIRVWNKLISKFHICKLLVNREQFDKPVLVVPRLEKDSAYTPPQNCLTFQ